MTIDRSEVAGIFVCQAEDGIRDLVRSRGLGDVYKRQVYNFVDMLSHARTEMEVLKELASDEAAYRSLTMSCLLYTSDAADERSSVDLGGRRIIKKKNDTRDLERASIIKTNTYTCNMCMNAEKI